MAREREIIESAGISEELKVKRHYTLSPEAIRQRREAAAARRPGGEGNRNAWKHGKFAQNYIQNKLKPCLSSCPHYPCSLVEEGKTEPGEDCLDKAEVIEAYSAIIDAIKTKQLDDFNDMSALMLAQTLSVISEMLDRIKTDGTLIREPMVDKEGNITGYRYKQHPHLEALPKMIANLGLNPGEFLLTPKSKAKVDGEKEAAQTLADLMSAAAKGLQRKDVKGDDQ